jgi:hypothetical protein
VSTRPSLLGRLRDGWLAIVVHFGDVQTLVILSLFYAILIGPMALAITAGRRDMLQKRALGAEVASAWNDADTGGADLDRAKLQS